MKNFFGKYILALVFAAVGFASLNAAVAGEVTLSGGGVRGDSQNTYRGALTVTGDVYSDNFFVDATARTYKNSAAENNQYTNELEVGLGGKVKINAFTPYARAFYVAGSNLYGFELGAKADVTDKSSIFASGKRYLGQGSGYIGNWFGYSIYGPDVNRDEYRIGASHELLPNVKVGANYLLVKTAQVPTSNGAEVFATLSF